MNPKTKVNPSNVVRHAPALDRTIETLERIEAFFENNTPVNSGALFDENTTMADAVRQSLFFARKSVRAVNAHEELLQAVKGLIRSISMNLNEEIPGAVKENIRLGVQAIARAEGKE